ncbi:MAG: DUF2933 domain-containing protein [Ramlibacter sp.]
MNQPGQHRANEGRENRWKWALAGFLAVAVFFLWTEHRAHLLGVLPYLLVLACPLMHLFHHGHGHHGRDRSGDAGQQRSPGDQS